MRIFAILLFCLNFCYLVWNSGLFGNSASSEVVIQEPSRKAPQSLQLLSEIDVSETSPQNEAE